MGDTGDILQIIDIDMRKTEGLKFHSEDDLRRQKAKWFDFPQAGTL